MVSAAAIRRPVESPAQPQTKHTERHSGRVIVQDDAPLATAAILIAGDAPTVNEIGTSINWGAELDPCTMTVGAIDSKGLPGGRRGQRNGSRSGARRRRDLEPDVVAFDGKMAAVQFELPR